ncbi:hypothetical protein [Paraburkholderia aspalathi]|uniref:Uncharacterized protein n=1 Tax=Paraburkholderia aspalathi TaxID=1324617 RepID=A0A1I7ABR5_9BURK|nr:hypothetical protein [Paraburkholderia aspalathi]SFT72372.1 hypothetical protein SAMN05192563_1003246 [Paraburkholderia aspalathi]
MFRTSFVYHSRLALLAGLLACALSAHAAPPVLASTGFGQAWPNAQDVSLNPHFHAYRFDRDGVAYVQINAVNGDVRAAFAYAGGIVLTLPMGGDASRVSIPDRSAANTTSAGEMVYRDTHVQVSMIPQADGLHWAVQPALSGTGVTAASCTPVQECGGGIINQLSLQQKPAPSACVPVQECGGGIGNQAQSPPKVLSADCTPVQECGGGIVESVPN